MTTSSAGKSSTRSSRSKRIAAIATALVFAVLALMFIDARYVVNTDAMIDEHADRIFAAAFAKTLDSDRSSLLRFHKGPLPCASYSEPQVSDEEARDIERELGGAHLLASARSNSALFWKWGDADERRRHGPLTDEEILAEWRLFASLRERNAAFFSGERLADAIRARTRKAELKERARADQDEQQLSHHELESLQGIWIRHPIAMSFPAFITTMSKLPRE